MIDEKTHICDICVRKCYWVCYPKKCEWFLPPKDEK